jgi:hypothetical protein
MEESLILSLITPPPKKKHGNSTPIYHGEKH